MADSDDNGTLEQYCDCFIGNDDSELRNIVRAKETIRRLRKQKARWYKLYHMAVRSEMASDREGHTAEAQHWILRGEHYATEMREAEWRIRNLVADYGLYNLD